MNYEFLTPANIWHDFSATEHDLEISEVRTFEYEGALSSCYYFTALGTEDGKVRCFARVLRPTGGERFPAIVVADEAVNADPDEYLSFVKEGYAVVLFDYSGKTENKIYHTLYPESLDFCNYSLAGRALTHAEPSARHTSWHYWTAIARRSITFALSLPYVSGDKVGFLGVSEGANVMWQTVAMDERVKCCCALFGWKRPSFSDVDEEEAECWQAGVDPSSYMPLVNIPVLVAGGSNDTVTEFTKSGMLANLPKTTPLYRTISVGLGKNMYYDDVRVIHGFFSKFLFGTKLPSAPSISLKKDKDGDVIVTLKAKDALSAQVFFAVGSHQEFLSFKRAELTQTQTSFTANLGSPQGETLFVVGKADFGAYTLSAEPLSLPLGERGAKGTISHVVYSSTMGNDVVVPIGKHQVFDSPVMLVEGALGIKGATSETGGIAILVDDRSPNRAQCLKFDTSSKAERRVTVNMVFLEKGKTVTYSAEVRALPAKKWQSHMIELRDLKSSAHQSPESFVGVKRIEFVFASAVIINNVLWV